MTEIFVVVTQANELTGTPSVPTAAYSDYMSALAFAQTIFVPPPFSRMTARDLIYPVQLTSASTPVTPTSTSTSA